MALLSRATKSLELIISDGLKAMFGQQLETLQLRSNYFTISPFRHGYPNATPYQGVYPAYHCWSAWTEWAYINASSASSNISAKVPEFTACVSRSAYA